MKTGLGLVTLLSADNQSALFQHSVADNTRRWGKYHYLPDLQFTSLDSTASTHTNTSTFSYWVNPVLLSWRLAVK